MIDYSVLWQEFNKLADNYWIHVNIKKYKTWRFNSGTNFDFNKINFCVLTTH